MRILMLYEYPAPPAGLATQGDLLYRGLKEIGVDCVPVHRTADLEKEWLYQYYKPDIAIGVGWWGQMPELVIHPLKFGVEPVPWLVADGWVANYQKELNSLRLIMTTSSWVSETYIRDGVMSERLAVQHIGCDIESFVPIPKYDPRVRAVRRSLGVADDEKLILTIGGDAASKGSQEMMKALAKVNSEYPKWRYVCKVWKQDRTEKQNRLDMALAEELGIRDKVLYVDGSLSREFMPYLYNACDIYAGPSRQEGFGMPHVEAQACGKPVVSVDAMGIKETVVHGQTGLLARVDKWVAIDECEVSEQHGFSEKQIIKFPKPKLIAVRANVDDLAEYTYQLLASEHLSAQMGEAARQHVQLEFDYRQVAKQVVNLLNKRLSVPATIQEVGHV